MGPESHGSAYSNRPGSRVDKALIVNLALLVPDIRADEVSVEIPGPLQATLRCAMPRSAEAHS